MITESASTPENKPRFDKRQTAVSECFSLWRIARGVLANTEYGGRITFCQTGQSYGQKKAGAPRGVTVNNSGRAALHGVAHCGMVWGCPICARKIGMSRREEINQVMKKNREKGGASIMVTLTFSHQKGQALSDLIKMQSLALKKFKSGRAFDTLKKSLGYVGQIRALEVTHGENGWHPHTHEIWVLDRAPGVNQMEKIKAEIFKLWHDACLKSGLGLPTEKHGVDVAFNASGDDGKIGSYLGDFSFEATSAHTKKGKKAGRSAWDVLRSMRARWTLKDRNLYREYTEAMQGRALIFFSRGLRELFGLDVLSDEDLQDSMLPDYAMRRDFTGNEWAVISRYNLHQFVILAAEAEFHRKQGGILDKYLKKIVELAELKRLEKFNYQKKLKSDIRQTTLKHDPVFLGVLRGVQVKAKNGK